MFKQTTTTMIASLTAAMIGTLSFATHAAAISHSVSDNSITIDANLDDWSSIASLGYEAASISDVDAKADYLEAWIAHDNNSLYLAYRNNGDINTSLWWPWQIYIDTDSSESTGFQGVGNVGAEYVVQGSGVYQYTGSGSDWAWQYIDTAVNAVDGAFAELKIPRSVIGNPSEARVVFVARNAAFTGDYTAASTDTYPSSFAPLSLHDGLLLRQSSIWNEEGGTQTMWLNTDASEGATQLEMSSNYAIQDNQLITYLGSNGEYYSAKVTSTNGRRINLQSGLQAAISAGQNVWNFYENGSHPNEYGYRAIADYGIRQIGLSNLNSGRHVLLGDSWFESVGVSERLTSRLNNATVINQGLGGNTSTDMLNRFDAHVASQNPDFVWVIAGVNDYHQDVPTETYLASMQAIIAKIASIGAEAIVYDSPVGQLFYGSDEKTQLSHDYAAALAGGGDGFVDYELGEVTPPPTTGDISNPKTISIDGDLSDWDGLESFGVDGDDITLTGSRADILEAWMAHDDAKVYMAYRNDGPIDQSTWWPWQIYLDTDSSADTGFRIGNDLGANYVIQGNGVYRYIGTGSDWAWEYIATAGSNVNGDNAELSFDRSAIGNPATLKAHMMTRNGIFTGNYSASSQDNYPNLGAGSFSYLMGEVTPPTQTTFSNRINDFSLSIDGDLFDWENVPSFGRDADDIAAAEFQADWLETWAAHDNNNLYFAYENDGDISSTHWPWQIYIDADNNPDTGFKVTDSIGADYVVEGPSLRGYTGSGSDWSWETYAVTSSATEYEFAEIAIPLSIFDNLSEFRLIFKTNNQPFTGSFDPSGEDYFPNNATSSDQGYLTYSID